MIQINKHLVKRIVLFSLIVLVLGFALRLVLKTPENDSNQPIAVPSSQTAENADTLPIRNILKTEHNPAGVGSQSEGWGQIQVQKGDTLYRLFAREKWALSQLREIEKHPEAKLLKPLPAGKTLFFQVDAKKGQLQQLLLHLSEQKWVRIQFPPLSPKLHILSEKPTLDTQLIYAASKIQGSLSASARKIGLSEGLVQQIIHILGEKIDFDVDIQKNDSFHVLFEEKQLNGKKMGPERILAVEFTTRGKTHQAIRYQESNGLASYFSPEGNALQLAYLRSPVEAARISSHFGQRKHPILHRMRAHKGVDYAAPVGTPVKAVSDAKVVFVGTRGGYGKAIELQHNKSHSTFYAHLSRFATGMRAGTVVKKGQIIGYVGKTGLASGPHLHYEFRINGIHRNPLTVALPKVKTLGEPQKKAFQLHVDKILALLNSHKTISMAKTRVYSLVNPRLAETVIQ